MDDCIINKVSDNHFYVVFNAGCKDRDQDHMRTYLGMFKDCEMEYVPEEERSLVAVQGPKAQAVLSEVLDGAPGL